MVLWQADKADSGFPSDTAVAFWLNQSVSAVVACDQALSQRRNQWVSVVINWLAVVKNPVCHSPLVQINKNTHTTRLL